MTLDPWQVEELERRIVGVDWGAGESRTVWHTWRPQAEDVVAGRRGGKTLEQERRAGIIRLEELEPGVWGRR